MTGVDRCTASIGALLLVAAGCGPAADAPDTSDYVAFVGGTIIDGTGADAIGATLLLRDGRIHGIGMEVELPEETFVVDATGKYIAPGLINAHGHVGETMGLESGHYSRENVLRQLGLYSSYGVTTIVSLGGDGAEGVQVRNEQDIPAPGRARLFVAGTIVTGDTPEAALEIIDGNAAMGVDFIKIRVDDQLGTTTKMSPDMYEAVIDGAHERGLPVAAHLFYLEDAHGLLDAGVDFIVHSVRDRDVDASLASRLVEDEVCYSPTLTREVSTFIYEGEPEFFEDPFFLAAADPGVLGQLLDPAAMESVRTRRSAQLYKEALVQAQRNLGILSAAGVTIAMGTDTGPPARFQGYFEHMELALMAESGMTAHQVLVSATGDAARCAGLEDVGTIELGKWADLIVLSADPLESVENLRAIEAVWIGGARVPAVTGG